MIPYPEVTSGPGCLVPGMGDDAAIVAFFGHFPPVMAMRATIVGVAIRG